MVSSGDRKTSARTRGPDLELFGSKVYDATSMRDLADRVGLTTAAIYYPFAGKAALLANLVEPFLDELDALLDEAAAAADSAAQARTASAFGALRVPSCG